MPFQVLNLDAVADYLHLSKADVEKRVKDREIPFEMRGGRVVFRKSEIDAWASQRILGAPNSRLTRYHQQSTQATRAVRATDALMPEMLGAGAIASAMTCKTKASVLRDLVALADKTGQVNDAKTLVESLVAREDLCSTALPGGFALPHPRSPEPYLFEKSFIVLGRPIQEIHFGSPDGEPTYLFFLVCCQDDRLHLHTLARLCLMAQKTKIMQTLRTAPEAHAMRDALIAAEDGVLEQTKLISE